MYIFRDSFIKQINARLIVERNEKYIQKKCHPSSYGTDRCCQLLKTQGLLQAIKKYGFDAAFGGARREEEKSRAKERIFSVRDEFGQWDPKNQRPEVWHLFNSNINEGESVRVFPLSNWTELDIWNYIKIEKIPLVPLYFARRRKVINHKEIFIPADFYDIVDPDKKNPIKRLKKIMCRFRSLGCIPCTGAIQSTAKNIDDIITELAQVTKSERENRLIDLTSDSSMEQKKREGYF